MRYLVIFGFLLANLVCSQSAFSSNKVYTWTDEEGTIHYGERPPKDTKATVIRTRTGKGDPSPQVESTPAPTPAQTTSTAEPQQAETESLKNPERCEAARKNLETLKTSTRIRIADADGAMRYLNEDELEQKKADMEKTIEQACE